MKEKPKTKTNTYPFLREGYRNPQKMDNLLNFPLSLPFVDKLKLSLDQPVTFFVGKNGSGKSTLLEAIAELAGLPISGGSKLDLYTHHEKESHFASYLAPVSDKNLRMVFSFEQKH